MTRKGDLRGIDMWMNASDWNQALELVRVDPTLAIAALTVLLAALIGWRRLQALEMRTEKLQHELLVFAEAARLMASRVSAAVEIEPRSPAPEGSRRYLVKRARMRVADGEGLSKLAGQLGLRRDELRLMNLAQQPKDS